MFLYKHDNRCTTSMTEHSLISVRSAGSICIINSQTDGLVMVVHTIGHHVHQIPFDYHLWGYVKAMVYALKVNTKEELL
jgi:hypothetical protein